MKTARRRHPETAASHLAHTPKNVRQREIYTIATRTQPPSSSLSSASIFQDDSCPPEVQRLGRTIVLWRHQIAAWHQARPRTDRPKRSTTSSREQADRVRDHATGPTTEPSPPLRRPTQLLTPGRDSTLKSEAPGCDGRRTRSCIDHSDAVVVNSDQIIQTFVRLNKLLSKPINRVGVRLAF